jgi:hypothetical protein
VTTVFDRPDFNKALFFARKTKSPKPPGSKDLFVDVAQDARVHVRLHDRPGTQALVLLFHGNGEVVADYDDLADTYERKVGASLAVADFRGYGQSTGTPTLRAIIADAAPVLDAVVKELRRRALVVVGRSLGGAMAAEICRLERPEIRGFVFESVSSDLLGVARRRRFDLGTPLSAEDAAVLDPLPKFAHCNVPALVLHGEDDQIVPATEAEATFSALPTAHRTKVLLPGCGHNDVPRSDIYWVVLSRFVQSIVSPESAAPKK